MIRLVWVKRRFRGCYETTLAATRLGTISPMSSRCRRSAARLFSHLIARLRRRLTQMSPLRGWGECSSRVLSHRKIAFAVATQSLKARSTRTCRFWDYV